MKKKILCGILTLMMVFGVFISVSMVNASAAGAIYSVIDEVRTYEVDTYDELKTALLADETQRVIVLTGDIEASSSENISITPNLSGKKIVLDLNGYNIHLYSTHYLFRSVFTIDQAGQFHIINTEFDVAGKDNYSEIYFDSTSGFLLHINNPQAEVSVMCGINLKSDISAMCINACHRLYMYGVNITSDYTGIKFIESEKDIFAQAYFSFNNVVMTTGKSCVDLTGIPELDIYSVDIDFNHVFLNVTSAEAAIISKQTQLVPKDFKHTKSSDPVYTYNNGHSTDPILYSTLEDLRTDRKIAYFNHPFMANGTPCTHSNKADFLVTTRGHVVRCSDCSAYMEYTDHKGTMTSTPPSSYGNGYTSGINCACGYKTYYRIPSVKPPKFFENIVEVSSFEEIKAKAEDASLTDVTLVLKRDITVNDDTKSYTIVPRVRGDLKIDLNGYNLTVESDATTHLFDMSYAKKGDAGTRLCISNSDTSKAPSLVFNSSAKRNAIIHIDNPANRLFIANITLQNGTTSDTGVEAYTQTKNIYIESAYDVVLNFVKLINYKENGHNLCFSHEYSTVYKDTTVKIDNVEFESKTFNLCFENNITDTTFKAFDIGNAKFVSDNSYAPVMVSSSSTAKLGSIIKDTFYISGENGTPVDLNATLNTSLFDKSYEYTVEYNGMFACEHPTTSILMFTKDFHIKACGVCNHITLEEHKKVDAVPPASCTATGTSEYINCDSYCGYKTTPETIYGEHDYETIEKCDATCSEYGWTLTYKQCKNCGLVRNENVEPAQEFAGSAANEFLNAVRIPKNADAHKFVEYEQKDATCTEDGCKETFRFCEYCNEVHKESGNLTGDEAMEFYLDCVIPKLGHNIVAVPAKSADCENDGNIAYWVCERCEKYYSDEALTTEIALADTVIEKTGHTEEIIPGKAATETETGLTEGKKCSVCNKILKEQEVIPVIPAEHKHDYVAVVTAPTCTAKGYTTYTCACGDTYTADETEMVAHTTEIIPGKAATETETGLTEGEKCSVCGTVTKKQEVIPVIPADHEHDYVAVVTAPTCTAKGYTTYTCACGDTYTADETEMVAHTPEIIPGKAATETETGLTDGEKCSVCGKILKEQEEIPVLGDEPEILIGDINKDGKITAMDARLALRISAKIDTPAEYQKIAADYNKDTKITAMDARLILRKSAKLE